MCVEAEQAQIGGVENEPDDCYSLMIKAKIDVIVSV